MQGSRRTHDLGQISKDIYMHFNSTSSCKPIHMWDYPRQQISCYLWLCVCACVNKNWGAELRASAQTQLPINILNQSRSPHSCLSCLRVSLYRSEVTVLLFNTFPSLFCLPAAMEFKVKFLPTYSICLCCVRVSPLCVDFMVLLKCHFSLICCCLSFALITGQGKGSVQSQSLFNLTAETEIGPHEVTARHKPFTTGCTSRLI